MNQILSKLQSELSAALSGLSPDQTQLRPGKDPSRWSIQEIASHLTLTYLSSAGVVETRISKGTPTKASPTLTQYVGQFYVTTLGRFPPRRKAPLVVDPASAPDLRSVRSGDELVHTATEAISRFDSLAARAESLFGRRRAISHMVLGPLSVSQWRRFHLAHGRHHIRQIAAILAEGGTRPGAHG